jgi:hypothetical protein
LLGVCHRSCHLQLACEGFPLHPLQRSGSPRPLWYVSFLLLLLIIQFLFFPWVGVSLFRGLCWSGSGLPVGVPCTA